MEGQRGGQWSLGEATDKDSLFIELNKYFKIVGGIQIEWSLPHQTHLRV